MLMKRNESLLLVIDVQEHLAPVTDNPREVIDGSAKLVSVAGELKIPYIITEQYPKGLGQTMRDVRKAAGEEYHYFEKLEFSCLQNAEIMEQIKKSGKKQIIITGVETHICVLQTAIDLQKAMHHLDQKEMQIIHERYFQGLTQSEIAKDLMISQAQVSRIEKQALSHLKKYMLG